MAQALKKGEIDVATYFDSSLLPSLESDENITVQKNVSDWWLNFAFNFGGQGPDADPLPALQDKNVRLAIAMAIDKEGIVDKAFDGAAVPGTSLIRQVPEQWHYDVPEEEVIPFDPEAANQLLDESGYAEGSDGVRVDPNTGDRLELADAGVAGDRRCPGFWAADRRLPRADRHRGEDLPRQRRQDVLLLEHRRLGRLHLVLDWRAGPQLPAHDPDV